MSNKLIIYTDGGSRGNPGPAAAGWVIDGKGYGAYLGTETNNIAEYTAIVLALEKARALLGKTKAKATEVEMRMDSELAVKQLNGEYRIKNEGIQPLFFKIWNLKFDFKSVEFVHVRRELNKEADAMVNKALDEKLGN
ncbi:MAG: hypothetical protein COU11_02515 [Candidatus Harrisonbacteria bacterium CG10_big_fil_rev_8_21_14_0_10_49_15]|uniref:RNase H type-1 domain-containing protein n=1 Tax=Candidatus Harrisonbacteria bacterium CG10_big_fil_rev_8_21_14_0_10_49_15 TaxID=1974587 RepID=A0A2H0UKZ2_9BACT|nr:MAG: hypothetical protein COU11_02515 [Candidatus Harrisonbacteria bacterium CG10_big_fil_rev_8_21_14_0_10_49_15]